MSKKSKKHSSQGTYALCITAGLVAGIGIGPLFGSVPGTALAGAFIGAAAGFVFTRKTNKKPGKRH